MSAPMTVQELITWFETNFDCIEGPPRAFIELHCGPEPDRMTRYVYETHAVRVYGDCRTRAEAQLVAALYADFAPLVYQPDGGTMGGTVLFWRKKPELVEDVEQVLGEILATDEDVEDGKPKPEGAVYEVESRTWRQLLGENKAWKLRTRLVIPALVWNPCAMVTRRSEGRGPIRMVS